MPTNHGSAGRTAEVVVGIGAAGPQDYHWAVQLGAEEAQLRKVPLRLVHGSRLPSSESPTPPGSMEARQRRGRRLVAQAAQTLASTPLGRSVLIQAEISPVTGAELLAAHSRTAVLVVIQRRDGRHQAPGPTAVALAATATCPTLVTRPSDRRAGGLEVVVLLELLRDPRAALELAFVEAGLRGLAVLVLGPQLPTASVLTTLRTAGERHPGVEVRLEVVASGLLAAHVRRGAAAALMVLARPSQLHEVADEALCPVLLTVPA